MLIYRLLIAGIIILISFSLGIFFYFKNTNNPAPQQLKNLTQYLEASIKNGVTLKAGNKIVSVPKDTVSSWIEPYIRLYTGQQDLHFSDNLNNYIYTIASQTDIAPVDAKIVFTDGKATVSVPPKNGQKIDTEKSIDDIKKGLISGQTIINLTITTVEPRITLSKINSLGINSLIATGESNFAGSSKSRVQNIRVSSSIYNGLVLAPGASFSFNNLLGDVGAAQGYATEKVIKDHKILYEYGGGICQVSTTMFRAAIYAGFLILERRNHSFPVKYYDPQGFDATVYPGDSDLRFVNNTPGYVLIQSEISGTKLKFDIYGTNDGREVSIAGPFQYDQQEDGSMKAYFVRTIKYTDGTSVQTKFTSIYKSPLTFPTEPNPYE